MFALEANTFIIISFLVILVNVFAVNFSGSIVIFFATLCASAIYRRSVKYLNLYIIWKKLENVPGPAARPFLVFIKLFGFASAATKDMGTLASSFQKQRGLAVLYRKEKMFKMFSGFQPYVFCCTPETIQPVLSSYISIRKTEENYKFKDFLGDGLVFSDGGHWRKHRKMLNPCFRRSFMKDFQPMMNEKAMFLVNYLKTSTRNNKNYFNDNLLEKLYICASKIIIQIATGNNPKSEDETDPFIKNFVQNTRTSILRDHHYWFLNDFLFNLLPVGRMFNQCCTFLHAFADKLIEKRCRELETDKGESGKKKFLLDAMIEAGFSMKEIRDEVYTFIAAGTDTTSSAVQFVLYMLGLYPEIQERVYQEFLEISDESPDYDVTYEDLKNAVYTDCVIKECLRMFPPPKLGRVLDEDTIIGGHTIPKGTNCVLFLYALHHDPEVFPDPERFYPERFLAENSLGRSPFAFLPFSAGPRSCIGRQLAAIEEKVILFYIIRHFTIESFEPRDKIILNSGLILKPAKPLKVLFHSRNAD